jgi:F-type H+-transporting ATPase subunit delta
MTKRADNFAKALFDMKIPEGIVEKTREIILSDKELSEALTNPAVSLSEKHHVIDALFDREIRSFLKVLCDRQGMNIISDIFAAYEKLLLDSKNMMKATFIYVVRPEEDQLEKIKDMLRKKYNKSDVILDLKEDSSLIGGFILTVGDTVYDKSLKGTLLSLSKTLVRR